MLMVELTGVEPVSTALFTILSQEAHRGLSYNNVDGSNEP
jgi:hypothetical protein